MASAGCSWSSPQIGKMYCLNQKDLVKNRKSTKCQQYYLPVVCQLLGGYRLSDFDMRKLWLKLMSQSLPFPTNTPQLNYTTTTQTVFENLLYVCAYAYSPAPSWCWPPPVWRVWAPAGDSCAPPRWPSPPPQLAPPSAPATAASLLLPAAPRLRPAPTPQSLEEMHIHIYKDICMMHTPNKDTQTLVWPPRNR